VLELATKSVSVAMAEDGSSVVLTDRVRHCAWRLDTARAGYRLKDNAVRPLREGKARRLGDGIELTFPVAGGEVRYNYSLAGDCAEVSVSCTDPDVQHVSLPVYQGLLLRGTGEDWEMSLSHGGHLSFSMAMGAVIGEKGALVVAHESPSNWRAVFGRAGGLPTLQFEHGPCPVDGWVDATVRLSPTAPDLTAACKRYRARLKERGLFVGWQEKIARKPIVRDLFGALMAFIGYNATPEIDYAACARRLRERGFESVFYYPVRMCNYSLDFKMGGDDPIWLPDEQVAAIKAVPGAHVGPWGWVIEGLDDGSEAMRSIYRLGPEGKPIPNWRIEQQQWYLICTPYQVEHIKRRLAGDLRAMDWIHFDVSAMWPGRTCFSTEHALHDNRPLGRVEDMEWARRLFSRQTVGNRVVSSEGFADHYATQYDVGSTKMMPPAVWDADCVPVPMTMLVLHDSCIQDWWEVHNYNAHGGFPLSGLPHGIGSTGCGRPELKAAIDALYGLPPNLFPFGKQYRWTNFEKRETASYLVRLKDEATQAALRAALPVSRLHKRIGMCELVSFEFISEDRAVQATTFSDGTRIVANLSEREAEAPGVGRLKAHSWREGNV
jgi:hypothetical protein